MQFKVAIPFVLLLSVISCKSPSTQIPDDIELLTIDVSKCIENVPASQIVSADTASIIFLANEPLVSSTNMKTCGDNLYFVSEVNQLIDVFDGDGRYLRSLGKWGQGPGEYTAVSDFFPTPEKVYVLDYYIKKIFVYGNDGTCERTVSLDKIFGNKLFVIGETIYLVNDYSDTDMGRYHIFRISSDDSVECFVPFDRMPGQTADSPYASLGDCAYYVSQADNLIYKVTAYDVTPFLKIDFGDLTLPAQYYSMDARELMMAHVDGKYCMGVEKIQASQRYLFMYFWIDMDSYIAVYDLADHRLDFVCNVIDARNILFAKGLCNFVVSDSYIYDVYLADQLSEELNAWRPYDGMDEKYRQTIENLKGQIDGEDNPILIKFLLKNE